MTCILGFDFQDTLQAAWSFPNQKQHFQCLCQEGETELALCARDEPLGCQLQDVAAHVSLPHQLLYHHLVFRGKYAAQRLSAVPLDLDGTVIKMGSSSRAKTRLVDCVRRRMFLQWPSEALASVARMQMEKSGVSIDRQSEVVEVLQAMQLGVQQTAEAFRLALNRPTYVTPTTFLELLSIFFDLVRSKQVELVTIHERFAKGLGKLNETAEQVAEMQAQLQELQPVLQATSEEVRSLFFSLPAQKCKDNLSNGNTTPFKPPWFLYAMR